MPNLITYDMGGTSTDVALIRGLQAPVSNEIEVEYAMPIHVPLVDVRTVGAGGGSIARVDGGGMLRVGPQSAGSYPGPICYGRGGTQPTISDANLLLGRLTPGKFGNPDTVRPAFEALGAQLGLSPKPPPRPSCGWPTPTWRAPSAWSRSRSAPTPATSPFSPSARRTPAFQRTRPRTLDPPRVPGPGKARLTTRSAASAPTCGRISSAP